MKKKGRRGAKGEKASVGAALVKLRWAKTTTEQRHQVAMKMVEARRLKRQGPKPS